MPKEKNHIDNESANRSPNNKVKFEFYGEEMIEKDVKMIGHSGRVHLPQGGAQGQDNQG
jgi:hypothetical protein